MWGNDTLHLDARIYQWSIVISASLVGAACDLACHRIPNWLTAPMLFVGILVAVWYGGWMGLVDSLSGCCLMAVPYVILFVIAGGGAGDAKLMGAIGAWLGISMGVVALLCVAVTGALLGIGVAILHREGRSLMGNVWGLSYTVAAMTLGQIKPSQAPLVAPRTDSMRKMPYGAAIFFGLCVAAVMDYLWLT